MGRRRRRSDRIGRNDACPCGSGRKYKRCCLGHDEAARSDPMEQVVRKVANAVGFGEAAQAVAVLDDAERTMSVLRHFSTLVERGEPLADLRFEPVAFAAIVEDALCHVPDVDDGLLAVWHRCAHQLAPRDFAMRARDRILTVLESQPDDPEDRIALAVAYACVSLTCTATPFDPTISPVMEITFKVQLAEMAEAMVALEEVAAQGALALQEAGVAPDELAASEALAPLQDNPYVVALAEREAARACDRVSELIEQDELPPFLTADEALLVLCNVVRALQDRAHDEDHASLLPILDRLDEAGFVDEVVKRLRARTLEKGGEEGRILVDIATAMSAGYAVPLMSVAQGARYVSRGVEEDALLESVFTASALDAPALEPYARYLESGGLDPRWVRLVQSEIQHVPLVLNPDTKPRQLPLPLGTGGARR